MMKKINLSSRIKLLMSAAIPLLIMTVTIVMVGASFAWFSDTASASVSEINLTTAPVFTLLFTKDSSAGSKTYKGEKGFDNTDGHLITEAWGTASDGKNLALGSTQLEAYLADATFIMESDIKLSSENRKVTLNVFFDTAIISYTEKDDDRVQISQTIDRNRFGDALENRTGSTQDITYGFTWFMTNADRTKMYTPYGMFDMNNSDGSLNKFPWTTLPEKTSIKDFTANGEIYHFSVVFAPEKLFWMKYCSEEWKKSLKFEGITADDIYTDAEIAKIVDRANGYKNQLFYSTPVYTGSDFTFSATVRVDKIGEETV